MKIYSDPIPMSPHLLADMNIDQFLGKYFRNPERLITCDPEVITNRNHICGAMLQNPGMAKALQSFLHITQGMAHTNSTAESDPLHIINGMMVVQTFYKAAVAVLEAIAQAPPLPSFFADIARLVKKLVDTQLPTNFPTLWESHASGVEKPQSATYKINFSPDLRVESIALESINSTRYEEKGILRRMAKTQHPMHLNHLLHIIPGSYDEKSIKNAGRRFTDTATQLQFAKTVNGMVATHAHMLQGHMATWERNIANHMRELLGDLQLALSLYDCAKAIGGTFAVVCPTHANTCILQDMVHPMLATPSPTSISNAGEMILLGGENQSGKTTFLRTLGTMQILFQMGLPLPVSSARMSPATSIFAVFSREEDTSLSQGKLGGELQALSQAINSLLDGGLFLGNEPITGTSPQENLLLSREALCVLKAKSLRGIWVTHIPALFQDVARLNQMPFGSVYVPMFAKAAHGVYQVEITKERGNLT